MENNFIYNLIRTKHWVIFLFLFFISFLSEIGFGFLPFIIFLVLFTLWTLNVGESLYNRLTDKSILNINRFKYQIYFSAMYLLFVLLLSEGKGYSINNENFDDYGIIGYFIVPIHLILMFFIFHTIYFISRCITTLRNKNEGYGWYMLGFWMFPIGIWIIQPRINQLLDLK